MLRDEYIGRCFVSLSSDPTPDRRESVAIFIITRVIEQRFGTADENCSLESEHAERAHWDCLSTLSSKMSNVMT